MQEIYSQMVLNSEDYSFLNELCSRMKTNQSFVPLKKVFVTRECKYSVILMYYSLGDVIYFPNEYLHATLNLGIYNVFIATFA